MGRITAALNVEKWMGKTIPLLLVDDDPMDREEIRTMLGAGYAIEEAVTGEEGWEKLTAGQYAAVLLDLHLGPGMDGFQFLERMRREELWIPVVIVSKTGAIANVVRAMKLGASNFVGKQAGGAEVELALQKALQEIRLLQDNQVLRAQVDDGAGHFLAQSKPSRALLDEIERVAPVDVTVLITGETGVGKEVVAREIHRRSGRAERPFFVLDCTTIRDNLAESLLFGHEKGAFSGALKTQAGRFEVADGGTLFLDEIGELSPELQSKFLRVLEAGTFHRLGGHQELHSDVRIIAATNRNLDEEVKEGRFRQDLLYRLAVATLHVPPLRERGQDLLPLAAMFLAKLNAMRGDEPIRLGDKAMMALTAYRWPGNVRELRNAIERCFLYADGAVVDEYTVARTLPIDAENLPSYKDSKQQVLDAFEQEYIRAALRITDGNLTKTAALMEMSRFGLQKAMDRLGIKGPFG